MGEGVNDMDLFGASKGKRPHEKVDDAQRGSRGTASPPDA